MQGENHVGWTLPVLISMKEEKFFDCDSEVAKGVTRFEKRFKESDLRKASFRAGRKLLLTGSDNVAKALLDLCPNDACIDKDKVPQKLEEVVALGVFGLTQDSISGASAEVGRLASLRLFVKGNRSLMCVPYAGVVEFMMKKNQSVTPTPDMAWDLLKTMNAQTLTDLQASCSKVYHGTVGPADIIMLPSNLSFAE